LLKAEPAADEQQHEERSMAIQVMCPHCDRDYTLAETAAGKMVRCKGCGEVFTVEVQDPPEEPEEQPRRRGRRRKAKRGVPLWVWLLIGGGGLAFLALAGVVVALLVLPGSSFSLTSRVSFENYEKLEIGMTEAELEQILGTPTERIDDYADYVEKHSGLPGGMKLSPLERQLFGGLRVLRWEKGDDYIEAVLHNGQAMRFTGHFANRGTFSHGQGNVGPLR
jgi:ribosomal protein S27E